MIPGSMNPHLYKNRKGGPPVNVTDSTNGPVVASFNVTSGSVNWSYQVTAGDTISIIASTVGNGLVAKVTDQTGSDTVVRFDPTGAVTYDTGIASVTGLEYFVADMSWLGSPSAGSLLATYADAPVQLSTSAFIQTTGNGGDNAAQNVSLVNPATQTTTLSTEGVNQTTIGNVFQRIETALPLYSMCNNWLQGGGQYQGISGLVAIQNYLTNTLFGHASVYQGSSLNYTIAAFTGNKNPDNTPVPGLPLTIATTFNDLGFFFNATDNQGNHFDHIGRRNYTGGSARAQALTAIHEVAHDITVSGFLGDFGKPEVGAANNVLVDTYCRGLIEGPKIKKLSPNSGAVGTMVTISGQNFGDTSGTGSTASTVMFNGIPVTPSSWSQTQIVVTVPANAATGNVTVTVAGQSTSKTFTVQ
jgi:hypothetical protein